MGGTTQAQASTGAGASTSSGLFGSHPTTGTWMQGAQQFALAQSASQSNYYNSKVAKLQAKDALARGKERVRQIRQRGAEVAGSQINYLAGGNVDVSSGSAAAAIADTAGATERDAATEDNNAVLESWGFESQARQYRNASRRDLYGGIFQALGTVLNSGG